MNDPAHQKQKKYVCTALLKSFRRQHAKKCLVSEELGVSGTLEEANSRRNSTQQGQEP